MELFYIGADLHNSSIISILFSVFAKLWSFKFQYSPSKVPLDASTTEGKTICIGNCSGRHFN